MNILKQAWIEFCQAQAYLKLGPKISVFLLNSKVCIQKILTQQICGSIQDVDQNEKACVTSVMTGYIIVELLT